MKPHMRSPSANEIFLRDLIQKIKAASAAKQTAAGSEKPRNAVTGRLGPDEGRIIAIGASTGGTEAIYSILKDLPATVPGIVIVQHIPPVFSQMYAARLNSQTVLAVKEAETGDVIEPGKVFVAPGDRHMKIVRLGNRYKIECFHGEKVNGHCPSVDVLFDSVARESKGNAVGILLTGMGYDGARGLLGMRRKGCRTIGQDEASAVVYGMPKVAYDVGAVEKQVSLDAIPQVLFDMLS